MEQLRGVQVFHFAGHALAGVNRAGLVLGPGEVLSARDLVALHSRNLELAVLSARETANGDSGTFADVNSLARTLAATGVAHILASRWRVDSTVTRQLMHEFYSNLSSGKSPANSLRAASIPVRGKPSKPIPLWDPQCWSILRRSKVLDPAEATFSQKCATNVQREPQNRPKIKQNLRDSWLA